MILFPAIDLFEGKAVRLYKGDYDRMTVYSEHPEEIAADFAAKGATHAHLVDLEGARSPSERQVCMCRSPRKGYLPRMSPSSAYTRRSAHGFPPSPSSSSI